MQMKVPDGPTKQWIEDKFRIDEIQKLKEELRLEKFHEFCKESGVLDEINYSARSIHQQDQEDFKSECFLHLHDVAQKFKGFSAFKTWANTVICRFKNGRWKYRKLLKGVYKSLTREDNREVSEDGLLGTEVEESYDGRVISLDNERANIDKIHIYNFRNTLSPALKKVVDDTLQYFSGEKDKGAKPLTKKESNNQAKLRQRVKEAADKYNAST